jgi:hypothetical protein
MMIYLLWNQIINIWLIKLLFTLYNSLNLRNFYISYDKMKNIDKLFLFISIMYIIHKLIQLYNENNVNFEHIHPASL